jgi:hypothetical protein
MRKFWAVVVMAAAAAGCQSGIGRAVGHAFGGVPEEVPQAFDLVEGQYLRLSSLEVEDIEAGKAETPEGKERQKALLKDRLEAQRQVLRAIHLLREYTHASSQEEAAAARQAALQRRLELLGTLTEAALEGR